MHDPGPFLLAVAIILGAPGPTNTLMAMAGASLGTVRSLPLLLAELVAYLIAVFAVRLLLAPIIHAVPAIGIGIKVAVAAYLVWMAIKLWRRRGNADDAGEAVTLRDVFVASLLNPKAIIFALVAFPAGNDGIGWYALGFAAMVLLTGGCWIVLGQALRHAAGERARYIPRIAALALLGFAGYLLGTAV